MSRRIKKIALGMNVQPGAFGGGNAFAKSLTHYLATHGVSTVSTLEDEDIDLILLTDSRFWLKSCSIDGPAALAYKRKHPDTRIVVRVNECDQRKGTSPALLNLLIAQTARAADAVVFVSDWLRRMYAPHLPHSRLLVIRSGADPRYFNAADQARWIPSEPLRLVTHHWSANWYKGWDVYQHLDKMIGSGQLPQVEFTFIGNPWSGAKLRHTTVLAPTSGQALAHLLKQHHVYISASQNEPAGMHAIEALQCHLPIVYRTSGSLPEYCEPYGIPFSGVTDSVPAMNRMKAEYVTKLTALHNFTYTAADMCQQYLELCNDILTGKPNKPSMVALNYRIRLLQGAVLTRDVLWKR